MNSQRNRFGFAVQTKPLNEFLGHSAVNPQTIHPRTDRTTDQFRPISIQTGVVSQSSGSCCVELGNTKVVCSIHGPRQKPKMSVSEEGKISCDFRFATFARGGGTNIVGRMNQSNSSSTKTKGRSSKDSVTDSEERFVSSSIISAIEPSVRLETIPKSIIDLDVVVLEDDGSLNSTCITACSVALADSGVELKDLVVSCTIAKINKQKILSSQQKPSSSQKHPVFVVDPSFEEERIADGGIVVGLMPSLNEITQLSQFGDLDGQDIIGCLELALDACSRLHSTIRSVLISSSISS